MGPSAVAATYCERPVNVGPALAMTAISTVLLGASQLLTEVASGGWATGRDGVPGSQGSQDPRAANASASQPILPMA